MGIFDFFKKNKEEAKISYGLLDLKKGYLVDYFMKTWEVKKTFVYKWDGGFKTYEFLLDGGSEKKYLSIEDDDELVCSLWTKIGVEETGVNLVKHIVDFDDAPESLVYQGKTYFRKESSFGECFEDDDTEGGQLVNWMYVEPESKNMLSIDRWGEEQVKATFGIPVKEIEFSNILPR